MMSATIRENDSIHFTRIYVHFCYYTLQLIDCHDDLPLSMISYLRKAQSFIVYIDCLRIFSPTDNRDLMISVKK